MRIVNCFLWGAATSAHQVEGNNKNSDWWQFETAGRVKERSGLACNHYNLYKSDFQIAKSLGHTAHRFSLEWSRLEPSENRWDKKEWRHYSKVIQELKHNGMEPIVTINHFTIPQWFAEKGGWLNEENIKYFSRFSEKCIEIFGREVKFWITINEPYVVSFMGYYLGKWPPGKKDYKECTKVLRNMLLAHIEAYNIMHKKAKTLGIRSPMISIAKSTTFFQPCRKRSLRDRRSASNRDYFFNHLFIEAAIKGVLSFPGHYSEKLPSKNTLDFIGINYYFREFVHHKTPASKNPFGYICSLSHHKDEGTRNFLGWESYSEGFYKTLKKFSKYKLPIMVTENGTCAFTDIERQEFIKSHLSALKHAIDKNVTIIGYLHWSLLDNFEWADGYGPRFGIVEVDYTTQERKIRDSAYIYSDIMKDFTRNNI